MMHHGWDWSDWWSFNVLSRSENWCGSFVNLPSRTLSLTLSLSITLSLTDTLSLSLSLTFLFSREIFGVRRGRDHSLWRCHMNHNFQNFSVGTALASKFYYTNKHRQSLKSKPTCAVISPSFLYIITSLAIKLFSICFLNSALVSMYASKMAQLGFFLPPILRPEIELTLN